MGANLGKRRTRIYSPTLPADTATDSEKCRENQLLTNQEEAVSVPPDNTSMASSCKQQQLSGRHPGPQDPSPAAGKPAGNETPSSGKNVAGVAGDSEVLPKFNGKGSPASLLKGNTALHKSEDPFDKDLMISYSHQDISFMRKLKDSLVKEGVSVWVDEVGLGAGVEFLVNIGRGIVDSKVFLPVFSETSVLSKYCKDELHLARISDKPIFPINITAKKSIYQLMDFGQFSKVFQDVYSVQLLQMGDLDDKDREYVMETVREELTTEDDLDVVMKEDFDLLINIDPYQTFWDAVYDKVTERAAISEVFNADSTVRIDAIENLGKFNSKTVKEALVGLLVDEDANARAVAAISLARTGYQVTSRDAVRRLIKLLNDPDRLVRESACLAAGRMNLAAAVPRLVNIWRNDVISTVREASFMALREIGGVEAEKAIQLTQVLAQEIDKLTK